MHEPAMLKPLHFRIQGELVAIIRETAQSQKVSYASLVRAACIEMILQGRGRPVLVPYGEPDYDDCKEIG